MIKDSRTVWEVHPQSPELGAREGETDKNPPKGTPRQRRRAVRSFQKGEVFFFFFHFGLKEAHEPWRVAATSRGRGERGEQARSPSEASVSHPGPQATASEPPGVTCVELESAGDPTAIRMCILTSFRLQMWEPLSPPGYGVCPMMAQIGQPRAGRPRRPAQSTAIQS